MKINIDKEEEIEEYIKALEDRTQTNFKGGYKRTSSAKGWISNTRCCNRKVVSKNQKLDPEISRSFAGGARGAGKPKLKPGVVKGRQKHLRTILRSEITN